MLSPKEAQEVKKLLSGQEVDMTPIFGALSDQTRCNTFRAVLSRKRLCVTDIVNILGISMSSASQHLKILEQTGLVQRTREGREIYFSPKVTNPIVKAIEKVVS